MIALAEQIAAAHRALALRRQRSPAWVRSGKLDAGDAMDQLRVLAVLVRTLRRVEAVQAHGYCTCQWQSVRPALLTTSHCGVHGFPRVFDEI
jgi:hypothetical protein